MGVGSGGNGVVVGPVVVVPGAVGQVVVPSMYPQRPLPFSSSAI